LVSLLILRRPADNEDAAVPLSSQNKICDIRSIGSSNNAGALVGERDGEDVVV
jgi:hypothetical protein